MRALTPIRERRLKKEGFPVEELRQFAVDNGEPALRSGRQEYMEDIVNRFI